MCEECGFTNTDLEPYVSHVRQNHPLSASMLKYDKRHLKLNGNGGGTSVSSTTTDNEQESQRAISTDSSLHSMD